MRKLASIRRKQGVCFDCGTGISKKKNKRCRPCNAIFMRKDKNVDKKQYRRNWHIKKKYDMEPDDFNAYWMACRGRCFICDKKMEMPTYTRGQGLDVVAIDHNHKTKKMRGLLCNACNKAIGFFNDDIKIIKKAIIYLLMEK